jgi:DNA-binding transcriptional regulator YdaS (Cro superfamily)
MKREQLISLLRKECERAGSQRAWAQANGLSAVYVSDVLSGKRAPAGRILAALGVEAVIDYRRIARG